MLTQSPSTQSDQGFLSQLGVPGDGHVPVCNNCIKAHKQCVKREPQNIRFVIHHPPTASTNRRGGKGLGRAEVEAGRSERVRALRASTARTTFPDFPGEIATEPASSHISRLAALSPCEALGHPDIAELFQHYINRLAPWYDLNDVHKAFGTIVPAQALKHPVLFKAIVAFAASHRWGTSKSFGEFGPIFHSACVGELRSAIDDLQPRLQGEYLAAACLLRSHEILTGTFSGRRLEMLL